MFMSICKAAAKPVPAMLVSSPRIEYPNPGSEDRSADHQCRQRLATNVMTKLDVEKTLRDGNRTAMMRTASEWTATAARRLGRPAIMPPV